MSGRILFSLAMAGAAIVATIVVSLTAVWGIGEMLGFKHSLQDNPKQSPLFYIIYSVLILFCALFVLLNDHNLVNITVNIEVMNALLLPFVLYFLYQLARQVLPAPYKLKGWYAVLVAIMFMIAAVSGLGSGLLGLFV